MRAAIWLHALSLSCWPSSALLVASCHAQSIWIAQSEAGWWSSVEVSAAEASGQLHRDFALMLKISLLSPSVPCLSFCFVLMSVCVCFLQVWKGSIKPWPPKASEQEKEDSAKMFSTKRSAQCHFWLILIRSYKKKAEILGHFEMVSADSGWHLWTAMIHRWLCLRRHVNVWKGNGWFQVKNTHTHTQKGSSLFVHSIQQSLTHLYSYINN